MTNRIREIQVRDIRLDPYESEVTVTVFPERVTPATGVRGRLVGPRSAYARTLEVAYPLRDCRPAENSVEPGLTCRVVIPEPSFWDPETPFLYEGPVELWDDGRAVDRAEVRHGLRTRGLGASGLRWNGRPITLRGVARSTLTPEDAAALRRAGCNTLVAPASAPEVWNVADRLGFIVLGRFTDPSERLLLSSQGHACTLGWLPPSDSPTYRDLPDAFVLETPVDEAAPREIRLRRFGT